MNDNGIEKLEQLINSCKYESRLKTLKKIVFTAIINFEQRMRDFIKLAEQDILDGVDLNEDPEKTNESKYFETQQEKAKAKWWNTEWKNIHEKFSAFFLKLVGTPENFTKNNHFYSFKIRYQEIVDLMISEIKSQHLKRFINIYKDQLEAGGSIAPGEVHSAIRKELTQIVYDNLSKILSTELGQKVWETISIMLNWVLQETFCIKEIKEELLQDTEKNTQQIIIKQIETLILRIARPAVDLFLRFPRHDGRISCMKRYVHEILILDMFYYNENNSKFEPKGLESYLLTGKFKIDEEQHTSSLSLDIDKIKEKVIFDNKDVFAITQNFEEARKQIEDDLDTFREYMKYSVYYGSGLEAYFHSELEKLKKRFFKYEKNDDSWRIRVFKEIENGNPNIPFTQLKLQAKEKYEIVKSLKEIKNRLNQR